MMLCPTLVTCQNLEELSLASHYWDQNTLSDVDVSSMDNVTYHQYDFFDMLRRTSLRAPPDERVLTKLTILRLQFRLRGLGSQCNPDPDLLHVFLSPTLRHLFIDRCSLDFDPAVLDNLRRADFARSTPLETLWLRDGSQSLDLVRRVLSLPRGLKNFILEYSTDAPASYGYPRILETDDWTELLSQQKDTLEEIAMDVSAGFIYGVSGSLDLRGMKRLRLFAGDILELAEDPVMLLPYVQRMFMYQYKSNFARTQSEWAIWDMEEDRDQSGSEGDYSHQDMDSDLDDSDMEDFDEDGIYIS
ncbi:uncharacterized protein BKCO1_1200077 [Diplodia corticola]|uniref:Uncharacterized protein n=1 Tax=Diplodia corticola TaxID=236234 RepID=A0A1J9R6X4_9PEZI|nr:uncharacterized protein BKCO1_1200077 [Diplodia corticola]OJD36352.1 hypothetical protein BKCO1_1200077 [Diplodia corticola]